MIVNKNCCISSNKINQIFKSSITWIIRHEALKGSQCLPESPCALHVLFADLLGMGLKVCEAVNVDVGTETSRAQHVFSLLFFNVFTF